MTVGPELVIASRHCFRVWHEFPTLTFRTIAFGLIGMSWGAITRDLGKKFTTEGVLVSGLVSKIRKVCKRIGLSWPT